MRRVPTAGAAAALGALLLIVSSSTRAAPDTEERPALAGADEGDLGE